MLFIGIFLVSAISNFGVSLLIYRHRYGLMKQRPRGFLGITTFGFLEDAVILPVLNTIIFSMLKGYDLLPNPFELALFLMLGVIASLIIHLLFSINDWKIWLKEEPWQWNAAGYWHIISLALQMAYFFFGAYKIILLQEIPFPFIKNSLIVCSSLLLVFAILFINNDKGVKLGTIKIRNKTW